VDPLLVITNSDAGTSDEETLDRALGVLRAHTSVEVVGTSNPGELDGALTRAGSRRIVVAGGDGSIHAVIKALYRRHDLAGSVLGLLPLGTGNDFARGNGIPLDVEDAAHVVLEGRVAPMDLIVDELGEIVVNSVHAGAAPGGSRACTASASARPTSASSATRSARRWPRSGRRSSGCGWRSTARSSSTSTGRS